MEQQTDQEWGALQAKRRALKNQQPCCIWFTGLSGAGKTTLARKLEAVLMAHGKHTCVLDGDSLRQGLCNDLGMSAADREENIRRAAEVARLMVADAGLIVIAAFISPFRDSRAAARARFAPGEFVEVFVDTPLADCEARDVKGLYKKVRQGVIKEFTGIDSPYEPPEHPDLRIHGSHCTVEESLAPILRHLGIA